MFQAVPHLAQVQKILPGIFVSNRRSTLKAARKLYRGMPQVRDIRLLGSLSPGKRLLSQANVIVTGSPYRSVLKPYRAKKCMVFHGTYMMLSKSALKSIAHYDLLCTIGPRMQQMIDRFPAEIKTKKLINTGFLPFCEFPEKNHLEREKNLLHLGLNPTKKTILYVPSRRKVGSWEEVAEALVNTAPKHYNLILRPHPSQALTSRAADRNSFKQILTIARKRSNTLLDLTNNPLPVLLSIADLIISDANSPAEESLFYDVPQLFIETSKLSRDLMKIQADLEGMHPQDTEQLLTIYDCGPRQFVNETIIFDSILDKAIENQTDYARQRQCYFSWVFGQRDQNANLRVAQAIQSQLMTE